MRSETKRAARLCSCGRLRWPMAQAPPVSVCGGTNTQGQIVTCMPQYPGFSSSNVSDSVTTTFEYEQFLGAGTAAVDLSQG